MYKKEIMIAVSIFLVLLVSAWWLNDQTKREYVNYDQNDTYQIQTINSNPNEGTILYQPFKAREYIRVNSKPSR